METTIHQLDEITINQIKAGEVIVNPASVVKELVDNALDANASKIRVEIKGGGRHEIRIFDNGSGMSPEDAELCFKLHATSKIRAIEDLERLGTFGFRGEALASVAAVSDVTLRTRRVLANIGALVHYKGGSLLSKALVPADFGTLFEVRDLFFNVPARRKFLKSPRQDLLDVEKCLFELSLAHLNVAFILISDGESRLDLPAGQSLRERLAAHGKLSPEEWLDIDHTEEGFRLKGVLSIPSQNRPNRLGQHLYLNGRPIQAWQLAQAATQGYGSALPEGRHPLFVLQLELPADAFDVNVHPQKKEVRFRFEGELKDRIRRAVFAAVQGEWKPQAALPWDLPPIEAPYAFSRPEVREVHEAVELPIDYASSKPLEKEVSPPQYEKRLDKIRELMDQEAFLVVSPIDLFYLTGIELSAGKLLITGKEALLFVDGRYLEAAKEKSPFPVVQEEKNALLDCLKEFKSVALDSGRMVWKEALNLSEKGVQIVPRSEWLAKVRAVKEPCELALLREASALGSLGSDFVISRLQEGVTEQEIALELEWFWRKRGAKGVAFEPIIAFGPSTSKPHYRASNAALREGMPILIDIGVELNHYHSDMTRMAAFGKIDPKLHEIIDIVQEAHERAVKVLKAGVPVSAVDAQARQYIADKGYGEQFCHSLGHGVGLEVHEFPTIRGGKESEAILLQENMVITIEPGIYLPGIGGARLEDTLAITQDGAENLTKRALCLHSVKKSF